MRFTLRSALVLIAAGCTVAIPSPYGGDWSDDQIITRDVCVIGGGSSGTYAALRLQDMGKSVVIVERKDRLGGHTETYTDPVTGAKIDIGVEVFHNNDLVKNYFGRFNVPLTTLVFESSPVNKFSDFRTGAPVPGYTPSDPSAALGLYTQQLLNYQYLLAGFNLPDPVPGDLLLPFGDFVVKWGIQAAVKLIFDYCEGHGDILSLPTIYIMKLFSLEVVTGIQQGFLTTERHDNSELYEKAQAALAASNALLLSSEIQTTQRDTVGDYGEMVVTTPAGRRLIRAKKFLITIPTTPKALNQFDLDQTERSLFSQFQPVGYYTALVRNSGIPDDTTITNVAANTLYNLPPLPGVYAFAPTGVPGLQSLQYGSQDPIDVDKVKKDIIATVQRLSATLPTTTPEIAVFSDHSPFLMWVPAKAIAAGFYRDLYALQGHRRTFYTGATFHTHDSTSLWEFTEALLPTIVA